MPVTIDLPAGLAALSGGRSRIAVPEGSVRAVLARLATVAPAVAPFLPGGGEHGATTRIFVNDHLLRPAAALDAPLDPDDVVSLVPAPHVVAGRGPRPLEPAEKDRYARHLVLPEVGEEGQRRLKASSALIIGAGGLGSPLALYLAAVGVGRIGIVDFDTVDASNLQRQVLHGTTDLGRPKIESARERIRSLNPRVEVVGHPHRLTPANALELLRDYDVVADATDNFPTRYLINDACVLLGRPYVYGTVFRFEGRAAVFGAPGGPCYRCLFPEPPPPGLVPTSVEGGILGVVPGVIGLVQATEAVKLLLGIGRPLVGRLLLYDALAMRFRNVQVLPDRTCPACGERPVIDSLIDYEGFCGLAPGDRD